MKPKVEFTDSMISDQKCYLNWKAANRMGTVATAFALALTGCSTLGPHVVGGNERYVVVRDMMGFGGNPELAEAYCAKFDRKAEFKAKGEPNPYCSKSDTNLCTIYNCVE